MEGLKAVGREGVPDSAIPKVEQFQVVTWPWAAGSGGGCSGAEVQGSGSLRMMGSWNEQPQLRWADTWLLSSSQVRAGVRGQEDRKPQSPMNGRGGEAVDSESLPQDSTWLLKAHLVLAANLQQRAGGCSASVTLRVLSSFMAWQAETKIGQGLDAQARGLVQSKRDDRYPLTTGMGSGFLWPA